MAPHSSTLAWKIPLTEEPGRVQSMGSLRVGHDSVTSLSLFTFMHWRRKWQPTPVFLPGESQGQGSLVGCCLWGHTELDTTEVTCSSSSSRENHQTVQYDLNQIPYDYTVEVRSRFKGLDLRVPEDVWTEVHDIVQGAVIKTILKKKKGKMIV